MNKLVKVSDIIDFGSQKGEQFFLVYRLHISYLEWLIEKTEFCFSDLSDFYKYGKIKRFKEPINQEKKELIIGEIKNNPPLANAANSKLMTIQNFNNLIVKRHLTINDFVDVDYTFSDFLIKKNSQKLNYSKPYMSSVFLSTKVYEHNFFCEDIKDNNRKHFKI
jgi:hypothetical protein